MEITDYIRQNWALVPIPYGSKGPKESGWNRAGNQISTLDKAVRLTENVGLAHAYSGTCAIDIDDLDAATDWLSGCGIDLAELINAPDAVLISSGRPNRAKLLYRLADPLPTRMLNGLEFRCGTSNGLTVQDVLPPSIHPDTGKPYTWAGRGDFRRLPELPADLLRLWRKASSVTRRPRKAKAGRGLPGCGVIVGVEGGSFFAEVL
jgi:putative DNA primase/helicase